jgi:predicted MFS family arabinose efflux permease
MRAADQAESVSRKGWFLHYSLFAVALVPFYLLPVWGGMLINEYGVSSTQTDILLSADMAAGTIAALAARYWIHKIAWRPVFLVAILVATLSNLACMGISGFTSLLCLRGLAGFAAGTMMAFPYAAFSSFPDPDRESWR